MTVLACFGHVLLLLLTIVPWKSAGMASVNARALVLHAIITVAPTECVAHSCG